MSTRKEPQETTILDEALKGIRTPEEGGYHINPNEGFRKPDNPELTLSSIDDLGDEQTITPVDGLGALHVSTDSTKGISSTSNDRVSAGFPFDPSGQSNPALEVLGGKRNNEPPTVD